MNTNNNNLTNKNITKASGWSITIAPFFNKHTVGMTPKMTAAAICFSNVLDLHWYKCTHTLSLSLTLSTCGSSFHEC